MVVTQKHNNTKVPTCYEHHGRKPPTRHKRANVWPLPVLQFKRQMHAYVQEKPITAHHGNQPREVPAANGATSQTNVVQLSWNAYLLFPSHSILSHLIPSHPSPCRKVVHHSHRAKQAPVTSFHTLAIRAFELIDRVERPTTLNCTVS